MRSLSYLPNTDTYYIKETNTYIKRWMFIYADADYVASMLGIEDMDIRRRNELFLRLSEIPELPPISIPTID